MGGVLLVIIVLDFIIIGIERLKFLIKKEDDINS